MAREPGPVVAAPVQRDVAIDFIRGAGILMIGLDHLEFLCRKVASDHFVNPFVTWLRIGWSGAAEFFVFFSGYVAGIVYLKTLQSQGIGLTWARAAQRSWHIYVLNLLTLCAVLLLFNTVFQASNEVSSASRLAPLLGSGAAAAIAGFLQLRFQPLYFEILNLYIVLLLLIPAIVAVSRVSGWLTLAVSVGLWLAVQAGVARGTLPLIADQGNFNPFAWQLVFVLGVLASMYRVFDRLRQTFSRARLLAVSGGLLLLAFLVKVVDRLDWPLPLLGAFDVPGYDKPNLGALQLVHFLVSVVFVMEIVPRGHGAAAWSPMGIVANVGRRSLECFCMSTVLVYAASALLAQQGSFAVPAVLLAGATIVAVLCLYAPFVDWVDSKPWRGQRRATADKASDRPLAMVAGKTL